MERETYQQILDKLKELDSWLSSLGLSKHTNRIHLHISNICKLEKARQEGTLSRLINTKGVTQLAWSLVEATEFIDIYTVLRSCDANLFREKLKAAFKGPVNPSEEATSSSSNKGRNTMFELNLTTRLLAEKVPVSVQRNPDILCEIEQRKMYIQCKRPFDEKNIQRNILSARRQLTRDLNNSDNGQGRGVIAISVSRILNPGDKLFVVRKEHMMRRLADDIQVLAERYSKSWKYIVDTRIIGILFHLITPAFVEEISLLVAAQQIDIFNPVPPLTFPCSSDGLLLRNLANLIRKIS